MSKFRQIFLQKSVFFHMNWIKSQLSKAEQLFPCQEDAFWARNACKMRILYLKTLLNFIFWNFYSMAEQCFDSCPRQLFKNKNIQIKIFFKDEFFQNERPKLWGCLLVLANFIQIQRPHQKTCKNTELS